jgi:hypothetical protein
LKIISMGWLKPGMLKKLINPFNQLVEMAIHH